VGHAPCKYWPGKGAFLTEPDLLYVRELLASTEALCEEVAARVAEARRLHDQARALHSQDGWPWPLQPSNAPAPVSSPAGRGRCR
jgi:hypothetical protein